MAQIFPSSIPPLRQDAGLYRELDVLERLRLSLPDSFQIFHSVTWHSVYQGADRHGEIDIVILDPNGKVLLMEVKAGDVILRGGDIFKLYSGHESNVGRQCRVQYGAVVKRLQDAHLHPYVANCLVLPDYAVQGSQIVSIPPERIIDSTQFDVLGRRVLEILSEGQERQVDQESLHAFFCNEFSISTNLTVLRDQVKFATETLSDGLATWVPRIVAPSRTVRIKATAGSGKTQLALALLRESALRGGASIYVCFNRSLADHMSSIAPTRAKIVSFHELCVDYFRASVGDPDFTDPDVFQTVVARYIADSSSFPEKYDLMVIDEGQDFEPEWVGSLLPQLKGSGSLYLMEDPDQLLYERGIYDLTDAVEISCFDNFRSPKAVCQTIEAFGISTSAIRARSAYIGDVPGFHVFETEAEMLYRTENAVGALIKRGFAISDIAVLTGRGLKRSTIMKHDQIGGYRTRRFVGSYCAKTGAPQWSEGELLVDSIYRFKGQSAPAVVLTEVDFEALTDIERRKLFVGMTRALMCVEVVLSAHAEFQLASRLK